MYVFVNLFHQFRIQGNLISYIEEFFSSLGNSGNQVYKPLFQGSYIQSYPKGGGVGLSFFKLLRLQREI